MNTETKVTTDQPKANETTKGQVEVIHLGADLHAAKTVVSAQFDGRLSQPAQKLDTDGYVEWVRKLQKKYPGAKIYSATKQARAATGYTADWKNSG